MNINLFKNKNFIFHWISSFIAQTGGFFTFVAMPWLVLSMTNNDPFLMAMVMASSSFPQAFFMLFGGVFVDKFSPLKMLYTTRILLFILMVVFVLLIGNKLIELWMIYIFSFFFGALAAIAIPASQAILPSMVSHSQLGSANGMMMSLSQMAQILGPILAGWLIWIYKNKIGIPNSEINTAAICFAFFVDAMAILISIILMRKINIISISLKTNNFLYLFKQGLSFCFMDKGIFIVLAYLALVSLFLHGTLYAGLPVFTQINLGLAEQAYGGLYASLGIGTLIGVAIGTLFLPSSQNLGMLVLICDVLSGIAMYFLGMSEKFYMASGCLLLMGLSAGFVMVSGITWFQKRTPPFLMGRVIGFLMFSILGLVPISVSIVGVLMTLYPVNQIISFAGLFILAFAIFGLLLPKIRAMGSIPQIYIVQE